MDEIRILVADDHPIVRAGLRTAIEKEAGLRVVAEAGDGETALAMLRLHHPDVAVLDINMPKLNGLDVARRMAQQHPNTKIIFLTLHDDEDIFRLALHVGAKGYLVKDSAMQEIAVGIQTVTSGKPFYSSSLTARLMEGQSGSPAPNKKNPLTANLTPTEVHVLSLIAEGQSSKEIAARLSLHYRTIENHRTNICRKLQLDGSNSLLRFALQNRALL